MGLADGADEGRDMVSVIKERVEFGEYPIDPQVVATAMLARCTGRNTLSDLWSEVLVAAQPARGHAGQGETVARHDPA